MIGSFRRPRELNVDDPWDGRTLEWMVPSPPPAYNFREVPTVHALDDFWHRKYVEDERTGRLVPTQAGGAGHGEDDAAHSIHLPGPSFWPIVTATGLPLLAYGALYSWWLVGVGALIVVVSFTAWAIEPSVAEE
jgi:cytochrome c oxidase subunit 1